MNHAPNNPTPPSVEATPEQQAQPARWLGRLVRPLPCPACGDEIEYEDERALFMDRREGEWPMPSGRKPTVVKPDVVADFTEMPFADESFAHVVFDPPHHTSAHFGTKHVSIMQAKYGVLVPGWEEMIAAGFAECFRVLKPNGTLIFKWGAREIPLARVLALTPHKPLYGHTSGAKAHTHWVAFLKQNK